MSALHELEDRRGAAVCYDLPVDGLRLPLRRYRSKAASDRSVLLLHGASTSSDTFLVPHGGLVRYLNEVGWDVWTLDWRGSCLVVDPLLASGPPARSAAHERSLFTLDHAAAKDIPLALTHIRETIGPAAPLSVVAHCLGAGCFSMALARGAVERSRVRNVVLSTMGLFYNTPWDGWIKAEDFVIERVLSENPEVRGISPHHGALWPREMEFAYQCWPKAWLVRGDRARDELFRRLTFMFGEPYNHARVIESLDESLLVALFGTLHLGLYLHAGQLVRRGYAAPFDAPDVVDAPVRGDLDPTHFRELRLTLITGAANRLWHRESVDLMYEWLLDHAGSKGTIAKHVLRGYAHQDLYWAPQAPSEVFPLIVRGLQ